MERRNSFMLRQDRLHHDSTQARRGTRASRVSDPTCDPGVAVLIERQSAQAAGLPNLAAVLPILGSDVEAPERAVPSN